MADSSPAQKVLLNHVSTVVVDTSERYIGIAKLLDVTALGPAGSGMMHSKARRSCQPSMLRVTGKMVAKGPS